MRGGVGPAQDCGQSGDWSEFEELAKYGELLMTPTPYNLEGFSRDRNS